MDGLTLLSDATAAGLTVRANAGRLVIRGPRAAEAVARRLLEHKAEVLAALGVDGSPGGDEEPLRPHGEPRPESGPVASRQVEPTGSDGWPADAIDAGEPCPACGSLEKWFDLRGNEHCQRCEADGLEKALRLADRAAELLRRNPPRQNRGPDVARIATEAASPTRNTSGTSGDSRAVRGLFRGCQDG